MSDDLVLYLPFDEGRGTIAYDKSGWDNNGTIYGAVWVDGKYGKGLSLDGYDDYVEVYPFEGTFSAFTIAFWMKTSDNTKDGTPISMSDGTQHNEILLFNYRNFQLYIEGTAVTTNVSANDGQWHFIAWTWQSSDGATKLYKDGTLAFSGTLRQGGAPDPKNLILGQEQDAFRGRFDPNQAFLGIIDEVRMYNRVLSADEIKQLYLLGPRSCSENYFILKNGTDITETAESFKVTYEQGKKTVCTLDLALEDVTIQEGDHIEIYATHSDTFPKIFDGHVKRYSKKDRAGEKVLSVECDDVVAKFEERSITKRYVDQTATEILLDVLDPFVQEGLIATDYVDNCTIRLNLTVTNKTVLDVINDIAFRVGWNWYVDPVQQFHFFETGPYLGTITASDLDTYTYRKDKSELVNRVTVLGAKYCYPDSQDLCEDLSGWSASGTLSLKDRTYSLPPQAGKYSVCSEASAVNSNYLEYTFPSPLDLSQPWSFKTINISIGNKLSNSQIDEVSLYLFTDSNNYFSSGNLISAFDERGGSWVNISLEVGPSSSWNKTGNPSWSSIRKFRVQVIYSEYPNEVALLVDKFFFAEGRRHGMAEDTASQQTYGLCEMPTVVKDSIRTDEECQSLAQAIVAENSQPKDILEDIVVSDIREDFALGSRLTIEVPEISITSKIVSFTHNLEEGDTYTEVTIANKSKTSSEVIREHEARLREQEGEKIEPSLVITAPSSTPLTPEQVLDSPPGPPSAPTGLTWESRPAAILVSWNPNPEADVAEYELWRGTISTSLNTLVIVDSTSHLDYTVDYDTPYYYALRAIDRVGNKSPFSNTIGPIYAQRLNILDIQDTVPDPCTITVEGEKIDNATTFRAWIKVTIQRNPFAGGYIVAYKRSDQDYFTEMPVDQPSSGTSIVVLTPDLEIPGASGTFVVRAATVSQKGIRSEWTSLYNVILSNTVAPSAPSTISCTPGINSLLLECSEVFATDFSHYEWYADTSSPPTNIIGTSTTPYFVWKPPTYDNYYVGVKAVDIAGNKSSLTHSGSTTYTPKRVETLDIAPDAVTAEKILNGAVTDVKLASGAVTLAKFASGLRPVQIVSSLPSLPDPNYPQGAVVFLTTDNKLYRSTGNSWTTVVPTSDLTGQIITSQIADNAITAEKILNGAVTDLKLASGAVTLAKFASGLRPVQIVSSLPSLPDPNYPQGAVVFLTTDNKLYRSTGSSWTAAVPTTDLSGQITTTQIADDAVTATKLANNVQPFVADLTLTPRSGYEHDQISYSSGTITLADGTTQNINSGTLNLSSATGWWYIYFTIGSTSLSATQTYSEVLGTNRGLLALAYHSADSSQQILILPFRSKGLNLQADAIAAGAITTVKLAAESVTAEKIAAGTITGDKIAASTITGDKIATNTITGSHIMADAITSGHIQAGAVGTSELAAGAVTADKIQAGAVTASKLAVAQIFIEGLTFTDNSPSAGYVSWTSHTIYYQGTAYSISSGNTNLKYIYWDVGNTTLTSSNTKPTASDTRFMIAINDNGYHKTVWNATYIHGGALITGTITAQEISADAVTAEKISSGAVTTDKLAANAVTSDKISANAVTAGKIAAGAVGTNELAANAVTSDKIQAGAVTASKLAVAQIFVEGLTFTDNSPSTGYVSWTAHTIYYQGTGYSISAGNTNLKYIYWDVGNTTLSASNTKPSWSDTRFMIAINDGGYHRTVWNATYIHGGTLITGTITAQEIKAHSLTSNEIQVGAITGQCLDPKLREHENVLKNPGFEVDTDGDTKPDYWDWSAEVYRHGFGSYEGTYHVVIPKPESGYNWLLSDYYSEFKAGDKIVFSVFARNIISEGKIRLCIYAYNSNYELIETYWQDFDTTIGWREYVLGLWTLPENTAYVRVGVENHSTFPEQNEIHVDAAKLYNAIRGETIINIAADKVNISGEVTLASWRHSSDVTKIDGGKIYTGSITADQIAAKAITTEKLTVAAQTENMVIDGDFEVGDLSKEWDVFNGTLTTTEKYAGNYALQLGRYGYAISKTPAPVKPGDKLRVSAYAKVTGGTARLYITTFYTRTSEARTVLIGSTSSTSWVKLEGEIQIESDEYYVAPYLSFTGASGEYGYFDEVSIFRKMDSVDIVDGGVKTRHIRFDGIGSQNEENQMGYEPGKMWWRNDINQLRFSAGTSLDKLAIIPQYPLYDIQAPPENYVPNQAFEIDRDDDKVPDFWEKVIFSGSPTFGIAPDQTFPDVTGKKGAKAAYIRLTAAGEGKLRSVFIPVEGGKKYFLSAYIKGSAGKTHNFSLIHLEIFDKDKSYDKKAEVDPPEAYWKTTSISWEKYTWEVTVPETFTIDSTTYETKYIRIALRNHCTSTDYETVFYDDVVFSEIRAASSTTQWADAYNTGWVSLTVAANSENYVQLTIPSADYDRLVAYTAVGVLKDTEPDTIFYCIVQARAQESYYLRNVAGMSVDNWRSKSPQPFEGEVPYTAIGFNGAFHIAAGVSGSVRYYVKSFDNADTSLWVRVYAYVQKVHYHR